MDGEGGLLVREARAAARDWIVANIAGREAVWGAYCAGSASWLADDAVLPPTSDLDVMVVAPAEAGERLRRKLLWRDALLDVSWLDSRRFRSPEQVLGDYHLAAGLWRGSVVLDPGGRLGSLQRAVAGAYTEPRWIRARCEDALRNALRHLSSVDRPAPLHDRVTGLLFGAGVTTHVLLVAGLRNPTVRTRYAAVRELLAERSRLDLHEELLRLLGSGEISRARVEQHLDALTELFDVAAQVITTPFPFAGDISRVGRPSAIDGSRELVERGLHREAVFWLAVTAARCQKVLHEDAPESAGRFASAFRELLSDLGIFSAQAVVRRRPEVEAFLPGLRREAEAIVQATRLS